ncbi:outer capsid glycoprotein VP7 [Striga asiatica]|uniref:Outer capsid glycoprotein VP7 n=1 Tax=Striga asiatica TaxID=4170 RepID=A0A5A7QFV0_STRAF|nr:outer capsid glycoprotein VP7 [Striga asiatica]
MDLWVVAAAAGAGYMAKNIQNLSSDKKEYPAGPSYILERKIAQDDSSKYFLEVSRLVSRNKEILNFYGGDKRGDFKRVNRKKLSVSKKCRLLLSPGPVTSLGRCLDENEDLYSSVSTDKPLLVTDLTQVVDGPIGKDESKKGPGTMLLFISGMIIGILSATTAWKTEVDKLNKQLKQMQNLVLGMKNTLLVKDITNECYYLSAVKDDTPLSTKEPIASPYGREVNKPEKNEGLKANDRYTENLELMSKIDSELEAELEMLENNMRASSLERIPVNLDFKPDTAANYAVCPWELRLRLHELTESKLKKAETESSSCAWDEHDEGENELSGKYLSVNYVNSYEEFNGDLLAFTERDKEHDNGERWTM